MVNAAENLNRQIIGFTNVIELALTYEQEDGYTMKLLLENSQQYQIELRCTNVSELKLDQFGGGLSQFLVLRVTDISDHQLDRANLRFTELEDDRVSFICRTATVYEH